VHVIKEGSLDCQILNETNGLVDCDAHRRFQKRQTIFGTMPLKKKVAYGNKKKAKAKATLATSPLLKSKSPFFSGNSKEKSSYDGGLYGYYKAATQAFKDGLASLGTRQFFG
jgi:hypothetical protein